MADHDYMKYQGVNPLEKLHPYEPYFFIRAQDKLASEAVQAYADLLKRESERALAAGNQELSDRLLRSSLGVLKVVNTIMDWQDRHPSLVKTPD